MKSVRPTTSPETKRSKRGRRRGGSASKAFVWMAFPALIARHFGAQVGDDVRWTWTRGRQECTLSFYRAGQPLQAAGSGSASARAMEWMWLGPRHSPTTLSRKSARELMRNLMEEISEQKYAASWLIDLEYLLWDLLDHPQKRGLLPFERAGLKHLAEIAGGWWTYSDDGLKFLPSAKWLVRYQAYVHSKATRPRAMNEHAKRVRAAKA